MALKKLTEKDLIESGQQNLSDATEVIVIEDGKLKRLSAPDLLSEVIAARTGADGNVYASLGAHVRAVGQNLADLEEQLEDTLGKSIPNGLDLDEDDQMWLTVDGEHIGDPIDLSGGIGGGGATAGDSIKLTNTTIVGSSTATALTIIKGNTATISYRFYIYDVTGDLVDGNATARYYINNALVSYGTIAQGNNSITFSSEVGGQLATGTNTIIVRVEDADGNHRSLTYTVSVIDLTISSTFDNSSAFLESELTGGAIPFNYVPYGGTTVEKTIYFEMDDTIVGTITTKNSGKTMSYTFSGLSHGSHVIRCWMTATVNNVLITSNVLRYDFAYIKRNGSAIVVTSDYNETSVVHGNTISIPYLVYSPSALTSYVQYDIQYEDTNQETGTVYWRTYYTSSHFEVDRTMQMLNIRDYPMGDIRIRLTATGASTGSTGSPQRIFYITVAESDLDLSLMTDNLVLDLETAGRSNSETEDTRSVWRCGVDSSVRVQFEDFNWITNGWMEDSDGNTPMKVSGGASLTIPFYLFNRNSIGSSGSGQTIEIDFMTDEVSNPNAVLMSCMTAGGPGFQITSEKITFASDLQEMSTQFEPGTRMKVSLVVDDPTSADKLMHMYINGVDGSGNGVKTYSRDSMQQGTPVYITASGSGAALYIYSIRAYSVGHSRRDVVNNMIATYDTVTQRAQAYYANEIFNDGSDAVGLNEVQESNPDLTILYITGRALPTAKVNTDGSVSKTSQTVSGQIIDPDPDRCCSFEDQKIEVQGTSSAAYYRKNLKLTIKKCTNSQGVEQAGYKLRDNSILAQKFTFKADVASSENANNVLLARHYNDTCPFASPAQEVDKNVRQGIDGKPCVIFFVCTDPTSSDYNNGQATFIGKYNFNLDKGSDPAFGFTQKDESGNALWPRAQSWEYRNNTSDRCLFRSADFTSKDSNGKFSWLNDFEARYAPGDDEEDTSDLATLYNWVVSTNTETATNRVLTQTYFVTKMMPNSVVYDTFIDENDNNAVKNRTVEDSSGFIRKIVLSSRFTTETITLNGTQYTVMPIDEYGNEQYYHQYDTATYRQDKFYQEFEDHFYLQDTLFYYVFTEFFLMVDNRAKNMFITTYDGVHWMFLPYDFDTAIGINNEGELAFGYGLEAVDTVGTSYVFNDQRKSVLWNNFMDCFGAEITSMFNAVENAGYFDPDYLISFFRNHQSMWPMTMWNEDADFKYGAPHRNGDNTYLPMWQGDKAAQRAWWLNHRSLYMCSKYLSTSALGDRIMLRTYTPDASNPSLQAVPASGDFAITPYQDAYVNVKWGSYTVSRRSTAGTVTIMQKPAGVGSLNDTETYIYSANTLKNIGDLSPLYVGQCDVSMAPHLEELILGSGVEGYENTNCTSLTVGNIPNMKKVDIRGLTALTGTLNLAGCVNIEEIYATNSGVTAVTLPNGGYITKLYLPAVRKLTICNQEYIEEFECEDMTQITALRIENCPTLDLKDILSACTNLQFARLTDVNWTEEDSTDLERLMQCSGIDENDNTTTGDAVVTGSVYIAEVDGDILSQIRRKFPYLTVTYGAAGVTLYFKNAVNDDGVGGEELFRELMAYGSTGYYPYDATHTDIPMPTLTPTAQYTYTFTGWSGSITAVTSSRDITAQYSKAVRSYSVVWKNGSTILGYGATGASATDTPVAYGTSVEWGGTVPAYTGSESDMVFAGWTFTNTDDNNVETSVSEALRYTVIGATVAQATFVKLAVPAQPTAFASCTWGQIIALCKAAKDGTLQTKTGYATLEAYGWSVGDECTVILKSGEEIILKIWGFDISEDENSTTLPCTIGLKYSLEDTKQMNSAARQLYGYTITGGGTTVVASTMNTTYYNTSGATNIEITFTERTYLSDIQVYDGNKSFRFYFTGARDTENCANPMDINYFAQEDCSEYTARAGKVEHSGTKDFSYTNTSGDTGHIIVDGSNGVVKVFDRSLSSTDNNVRAIEFMPGSKLTIPMSADGRIVITGRALWNGRGYYGSDLRNWLLNTFIDELPAIIQQRLVPVKRITQIGGLDWDDFDTYYDKLIIPTVREVGLSSATSHPFCDENNTPFPTFSSNDMRKLATYRGGDQDSAARVWLASAYGNLVLNFSFIVLDGTYYSSYATNWYAVLFGFCVL